MRLQHIISTMNRADFSFLENLGLKSDVLVVNQNCSENEEELTLQQGIRVKVISTPEKGLSRSRNMLINNADGDILIVGDDDVEYLEGYQDVIKAAYSKYADADIIIFRFTHEKGKETRARFSQDVKVTMQNVSKFASVEITLKRESILKSGVAFNNKIGLGTQFPSGEENAFLADAIRAGLKVYHVPVTICVAEEAVKINDSYDVIRYLEDKGASFYCIYKNAFPLYALAFIVLKKRSHFKDISILKGYTLMCKGKKKYKSIKE